MLENLFSSLKFSPLSEPPAIKITFLKDLIAEQVAATLVAFESL